MYLDIDDSGELAVYVEETDDCYTCFNLQKCQFIEALQAEVVVPRYENISIKDCKLFRESKDLMTKLSEQLKDYSASLTWIEESAPFKFKDYDDFGL